MSWFGGPVPDQYYAVTSRLAAAGHQRTTMRLVAGCILILAVPAALAAPNPAASGLPGGRAVLAVIPVACLVLAAPWLRYRWPTRAQSIAVVTLGALLLAAGCVIAANPFSGLLMATAFSFVLGFAALFHGTRLQALVVVVASATITWVAARIAASDLANAVAVSTPVVLINVAVYVACRTIAELTAAGGTRTDVEPLTGLLTRESFDELAGTLLGARHREDDRYLVLVVAGIDNIAAELSLHGRRGVDRARIAVAQALRDTVRHDALIGHVGDDEFLVVDVFTTPDPAPLAERIRGAVSAAPGGHTASIGVVSTPLGPLCARPPQEVLDEIVALGTSAMARARRRGGNEAEYVLNPLLRGPEGLDF